MNSATTATLHATRNTRAGVIALATGAAADGGGADRRRRAARVLRGPRADTADTRRTIRVASPSSKHRVARARARCYSRRNGSGGPVLARRRALVRGALPGADAGAGARLAADRARRGHARRRADRLRKDARCLPMVARPPDPPCRGGHARGPYRGRLRLAAEGARQRCAAEPRAAARRDG